MASRESSILWLGRKDRDRIAQYLGSGWTSKYVSCVGRLFTQYQTSGMPCEATKSASESIALHVEMLAG